MRLVDKSCWERGCACHDDRVDKESVAIVKQRTWVGLTDGDIDEIWKSQTKTGEQITRAIEAKLRTQNGY